MNDAIPITRSLIAVRLRAAFGGPQPDGMAMIPLLFADLGRRLGFASPPCPRLRFRRKSCCAVAGSELLDVVRRWRGARRPHRSSVKSIHAPRRSSHGSRGARWPSRSAEMSVISVHSRRMLYEDRRRLPITLISTERDGHTRAPRRLGHRFRIVLTGTVRTTGGGHLAPPS